MYAAPPVAIWSESNQRRADSNPGAVDCQPVFLEAFWKVVALAMQLVWMLGRLTDRLVTFSRKMSGTTPIRSRNQTRAAMAIRESTERSERMRKEKKKVDW